MISLSLPKVVRNYPLSVSFSTLHSVQTFIQNLYIHIDSPAKAAGKGLNLFKKKGPEVAAATMGKDRVALVNPQRTLSKELKNLVNNPDYCDVIFVLEDKPLYAHRCIHIYSPLFLPLSLFRTSLFPFAFIRIDEGRYISLTLTEISTTFQQPQRPTTRDPHPKHPLPRLPRHDVFPVH